MNDVLESVACTVRSPAVPLLEQDLAFLVRGLEGLYRRRKYPLERAQYLLLLKLLDGRRSSGDLATMLDLDHSTVTRQIAALERNHYVVRHANPEDGRSALIEMTDLGRTRCSDMRRERLERVDRMLSDWTEEDRQVFSDLVARFLVCISTAGHETTGSHTD